MMFLTGPRTSGIARLAWLPGEHIELVPLHGKEGRINEEKLSLVKVRLFLFYTI